MPNPSISIALNSVTSSLNSWLNRELKSDEDLAVLAPLLKLDGTPNLNAKNKLVITVVNTEFEPAQMFPRNQCAGGATQQPQPLRLKLSLLVSSNFESSQYENGIELLSRAIAYFTENTTINQANTPQLPAAIQSMEMTPHSLSSSEVSELWASQRTAYRPSVVFRVRLETIPEVLKTEKTD